MRFPVGASGGPFDVFDFGSVPLAGGEKCRLEIAHLGGQRKGKDVCTMVRVSGICEVIGSTRGAR